MYFNSQTMNYKFLLTFLQSEKFGEKIKYSKDHIRH